MRFLTLVLILAASVPAWSQSLGEAAKKEKERRAAKRGQNAPVITDKELAEADGNSLALPPSGAESASPSAPPASANYRARLKAGLGASESSPSDDALLRQKAQPLRSRMTSCQYDVTTAETALKAAEQIAWKAGSSYSASSLVANAKAQVEGAKRRCAGIEDEARLLGIPPGYLR